MQEYTVPVTPFVLKALSECTDFKIETTSSPVISPEGILLGDELTIDERDKYFINYDVMDEIDTTLSIEELAENIATEIVAIVLVNNWDGDLITQ